MRVAEDGLTVLDCCQLTVEDVSDRLIQLGYVASVEDVDHIS